MDVKGLKGCDAINLRDVWFSYNGNGYVLRGINLDIQFGSSAILVGHNGSGKTTLLRIINGLLDPEKGSVRTFGGEARSEQERRLTRRRIGYIPQQLGLIRNASVFRNVLMGALPRLGSLLALLPIYPEDEVEYARRCINLVGMTHKIDEKVQRLSGGERQRVAIARTLMQKPSIILADEFTSDLDYVTARDVMDIMGEVRRDGVTLLMAMHNIELAAEYGDTVIFVRDGEKAGEIRARDLTEETARTMLA